MELVSIFQYDNLQSLIKAFLPLYYIRVDLIDDHKALVHDYNL